MDYEAHLRKLAVITVAVPLQKFISNDIIVKLDRESQW